MSPRLASARTSRPWSMAHATVRSSARPRGAPRRPRRAGWALPATPASARATIAASQCVAIGAAARSAGVPPASWPARIASGHSRAGSGSRPSTICDCRAATAAARRSPKCRAMRPSCHAPLAHRLAGDGAGGRAHRRAALDLRLPGLRGTGRRRRAVGCDQSALMEAASGQAQRRTALFSVAAAVFLIALKLVTGLVTGSLAFVAEAAHSGTDLVAAILTLLAIRLSLRPADESHHYGHGKAEQLAALAESTFLGAVSAFIGYEALHRLSGSGHPQVDATWWAFVVVGVVMAVDASRAVLSLRASRRHQSRALAATALHFASDFAASFAVLVGLVFVSAGEPDGDAVAALVVAVLVMAAAARLAFESANVLMDRAPAEAEAAVHRALTDLDDTVEVRRVRVRQAAGKDFIDVIVGLKPDAGLAQAHTTADAIEDAIAGELRGADVVVHVEPMAGSGDLRERATVAALSIPEVREVHNVRAMHVAGAYELSLHVKLPRGMALGAAHDTVERLEAAIRTAVPEVRMVHTHIEPLSQTDWASMPEQDEVASEREAIDEVAQRHPAHPPATVEFRDGERGRVALISILLPADEPLPSAHRRAGRIEEALRERCPELAEVVVHTEPISAPS